MNLGKSTLAPRRRRIRQRRREREDAAQSLEKLRRALLRPEQTRIDDLERRPDVTAESVGDVLPDAVARVTGASEKALAIALEPSVTTAVSGVVSRRPEMFAEILAPTIGAAVRKAVADAFAALLQRFDEALERSLSVRSLQWRIEAARTGVPFAEVVLLRTLRYRVEQVFLIHTATALVLEHVADPLLRPQEPDQVAAMLSAIDAFGREALGSFADDAHLDKLKLGELTVWVCRGPLVTLAAVVRGTATEETAARLAEARERIALAHQADLARFEGDVAPFAETRPVLETLLEKATERAPRRAHVWLAVFAALVLALAGVLGWRAHTRHEADARARTAARRALEAEPGIVITSLEWRNGRGRVAGLRDPLSAPPNEILARAGLAPVVTAFAPFASLDARIVQRRAERALAPPPGVALAFHDGVLSASGVAPRAWSNEARLVARSLAGVARYEDDALVADEDAELRAAVAAMDRVSVSFARDEATVGEPQEAALEDVARSANRVVRAARAAGAGVCIEVIGHADRTGASERNARLSDARAAAAMTRLRALGVPAERVHAVGAGEWSAEGPLARSVTFEPRVGPPSLVCGGAP